MMPNRMSHLSQDNPMLEEIVRGLTSVPKTLPSKYFYDRRGAELFNQICELEEYYPTRTEISILESCVHELTSRVGKGVVLYEFGSGSGLKTQILLRDLKGIVRYVPIDICQDYLDSSTCELQKKFPDLTISPLCTDFGQRLDLSQKEDPHDLSSQRMGFFPGSTIGNFTPDEAQSFLRNVAATLGPGAKFIIGVDTVKDVKVLERAYNDQQGVTEQFNLNILRRINRELGGNFHLNRFRHLAYFNRELSRIEMHLVCLRNCEISLAGYRIPMSAGESIHTENSYKYTQKAFVTLAEESGFQLERCWSDLHHYFCVFLLSVPSDLSQRRAGTSPCQNRNEEAQYGKSQEHV